MVTLLLQRWPALERPTLGVKTKTIVAHFPKVVGSNLPGPDETYRAESIAGHGPVRVRADSGQAA